MVPLLIFSLLTTTVWESSRDQVGSLVRRSKWLATLADPWVRLVDPFIGEAVGMRVDVDLEDGTTASGIFVHKLLSDSVGYAPKLAGIDLNQRLYYFDWYL